MSIFDPKSCKIETIQNRENEHADIYEVMFEEKTVIDVKMLGIDTDKFSIVHNPIEDDRSEACNSYIISKWVDNKWNPITEIFECDESINFKKEDESKPKWKKLNKKLMTRANSIIKHFANDCFEK